MPTENSGRAVNKRTSKPGASWWTWLLKGLAWAGGIVVALIFCALMAGLLALAVAYPNLPDVSDLAHYRPKLPLRVYTAEGALIGEFGEERRNLVPIGEIPQVMKDAVLAIEDTRFYEHSGVDFTGVVRAALANILGRGKAQGASTITMQVARNVYLSSEKTYTRKTYEMLLTFKLERLLSKDQILEIYMNQIFLGNRAYGFATAAETYFGKPLKDITLAEAAMLAGLPKFPSSANPIANFARARERQLYILDRMRENGFITAEQAAQAKQQELHIRPTHAGPSVHAEYVAEMVRQMVFTQYGDETYSRGLNVYTSINTTDQNAAYEALRSGILNYDRRQPYRGPEKFIELPPAGDMNGEALDEALAQLPDADDMPPALVLQASARQVVALLRGGQRISIEGAGLKAAQSGLSSRAQPNIRIRPGAVIRVVKSERGGQWAITQLPEVEGALVALDPRNGAVKALVGGFDFGKNKFNHVTQAWRQPGSSFKPFIYSASLEKGFSPATVIDDAPLFFDASVTGGQPWEPKNYEGGFEGPMTMRRALTRSRNTISIRILKNITPAFGQEWVTHFGFDAGKHPAYLTMALGAGSVTPMQLAAGYAVFANGGYRVSPFLITRITDHTGKVLLEAQPTQPLPANRAIDARNAFITGTMLQDVARSGTAAKAQATLRRPDLYGKTGTTNDAYDAWFAGYQPSLVGVVWMGYDTPRNLGARETGGGLSLPIWINFMKTALKNTPVEEVKPPQGITRENGDWTYAEYAHGGGITNLDGAGLAPPEEPEEDPGAHRPPATSSQERNRILDLFSN